MTLFPRTYEVVRAGSMQAATISNPEELLELRTELELVLQFGHETTPGEIDALDEQLRIFTGQSDNALARQDSLVDMRTILADALDPANTQAAKAIDADFPEIKETLDMESIKKEKRKFRKEVDQQLGTNDTPADDTESDQLESTAEPIAAEASDVEETSALPTDDPSAVNEALSEADSLLDELLPSTDVQEPQTDETETPATTSADAPDALTAETTTVESEVAETSDSSVDSTEAAAITTLMEQLAADADQSQATPAEKVSVETTVSSLISANEDMNEIADSLENATDDLADLQQTLQGTTPSVHTSASESQDETIDEPGALESGDVTDTNPDDAAFDAMAAELESAVNTPPTSPQEPESPTANDVPSEVTASNEPDTTQIPVDQASATTPASYDMTDMRTQLEDIKTTLVVQIDRLADLMGRSAEMQVAARQTLDQANHFRLAAEKSQEASRRFSAAQSAAEEARAAYEQAQASVTEARQEWESAQQVAADVAGQILPATS